jgi:uncharacterized protein with von Willebrand factor type A (vWA) domain
MSSRLAENVLHFARVLRDAGARIATDRIALALQALEVAGLESRENFRAVLAATLISRAEDRPLFEQAYRVFWRDPDLLGRIMGLLLPRAEARHDARLPENRRLGEALFSAREKPPAEPPRRIELDAQLSASDKEVLRRADFETMSAAEWSEAKRVAASLSLHLPRRRTRRHRSALHGRRMDLAATLRASLRQGGEILRPLWLRPVERTAPLVVLADISGSMSRYSRIFLHFLHAASHAGTRTESFVFGTRLTRITRAMRARDPDDAVAAAVRSVADWQGGTRIAASLACFNREWGRRVLGGGATVLLLTDGLEREDAERLGFEAGRLARSCRRLVWLNPLLRFEGFEPRAAGVRALLPEVDDLLPAHNLDSLAALTASLAALQPRPEKGSSRWNSARPGA